MSSSVNGDCGLAVRIRLKNSNRYQGSIPSLLLIFNVRKCKIMDRNKELIKKYKRLIKELESKAEGVIAPKSMLLLAKINVYRIVIVDLQE